MQAGRRIVTGVMMLILLAGLATWGWWEWALKPYSAENAKQIFTVQPGMTAAQVGKELESRKLIRNASAFQILARYQEVDAKLRAGEYSFAPAMSTEEIIKSLLQGPDPDIVRVTIPEGYTTRQIVEVLADKGLGTKDEFMKTIMNDTFDYAFLSEVPPGEHRLEGFLFPDTYFFIKGNSTHEIIDRFLQRFANEYTPETEKRLKDKGLSVYDWVTLSSIVEKEAQKESDRPLIAGVLNNRLRIGMPLQVDATIQFLFDKPKPKLYNKDLQIQSPYNTYLHTGLPPGPIASPGHASLQGVLYPTDSSYLYYLAKNDGYHVFAKTFEEHLRNQRLYQQ